MFSFLEGVLAFRVQVVMSYGMISQADSVAGRPVKRGAMVVCQATARAGTQFIDTSRSAVASEFDKEREKKQKAPSNLSE